MKGESKKIERENWMLVLTGRDEKLNQNGEKTQRKGASWVDI